MSFDKVYSEIDNEKFDIFFSQKICNHKWKPIVLFSSTVYDCDSCGVKQEDYIKWMEKENSKEKK